MLYKKLKKKILNVYKSLKIQKNPINKKKNK